MNAQTTFPPILIISTYKDLELVKLKTIQIRDLCFSAHL